MPEIWGTQFFSGNFFAEGITPASWEVSQMTYDPEHLQRWTLPPNYFGAEWPDYFLIRLRSNKR